MCRRDITSQRMKDMKTMVTKRNEKTTGPAAQGFSSNFRSDPLRRKPKKKTRVRRGRAAT
jgi:hypothetical protein